MSLTEEKLRKYLADKHGVKPEEVSGVVEQLVEQLDEFVHDMKSEEAAEINNVGIDRQLSYLEIQEGDGDIEDMIDTAIHIVRRRLKPQ